MRHDQSTDEAIGIVVDQQISGFCSIYVEGTFPTQTVCVALLISGDTIRIVMNCNHRVLLGAVFGYRYTRV